MGKMGEEQKKYYGQRTRGEKDYHFSNNPKLRNQHYFSYCEETGSEREKRHQLFVFIIILCAKHCTRHLTYHLILTTIL